MQVVELSVREMKKRLEAGEEIFLLDVREPSEYQRVNLKGHLIPLGELPTRVDELDKNVETVVYCHHGNRSRYATEFLLRQGFRSVQNLTGGIEAWAVEIDPTLPRY